MAQKHCHGDATIVISAQLCIQYYCLFYYQRYTISPTTGILSPEIGTCLEVCLFNQSIPVLCAGGFGLAGWEWCGRPAARTDGPGHHPGPAGQAGRQLII